MHCEGCVSDVKRKIEEMEGRYSCSLKFDICTETFCTWIMKEKETEINQDNQQSSLISKMAYNWLIILSNQRI